MLHILNLFYMYLLYVLYRIHIIYAYSLWTNAASFSVKPYSYRAAIYIVQYDVTTNVTRVQTTP